MTNYTPINLQAHSKTGWRTITVRCAINWIKRSDVRYEKNTSEYNHELEITIEPEVYGHLEMEEIVNMIQQLSTSLRTVF